jgi:transposase, IS30 family
MERLEIGRYVRQRLREYWSPDQIAGRLRKEFPRERRRRISHQTIYAWIEGQGAAGERWRRCLRRKGRKRSDAENRGRIPASTSIDGRPAIVDRRGRYGDWEGDTVVGANHRGGAVTLVERKSGYLLLGGRQRPPRDDGLRGRCRLVRGHAAAFAEDADAGQRQRVCGA